MRKVADRRRHDAARDEVHGRDDDKRRDTAERVSATRSAVRINDRSLAEEM
jgi:hypothetical protein